MAEERFHVSVGDGVLLACRIRRRSGKRADGLVVPESLQRRSGKRADGLVVLAHGRLHTKSRGPLADIEERLAFDTFAFDARGMGESDGTTGYSNTEQECDDLHTILRHLVQQRGETIRAIAGHSKGAVVALMYASRPDAIDCQLFVSVSARYDARDSSAGVERFSQAQRDELERTGRFEWLRYRCGPEPDRPDRRPYIVTREDIDAAAKRSLVCVEHMAPGMQALVLHGKGDGTVPYANSVRVDEAIGRGAACSDLMLFDGIGHNWDGDGESALLASAVGAWIEQRSATPARKRSGPLVDHLSHARGR